MYTIQLTEEGERLLRITLACNAPGVLYPAEHFLPSEEPDRYWTYGNSLLILLDTDPVTARSREYTHVLEAILNVSSHPTRSGEVVRQMVEAGHIDCDNPPTAFQTMVELVPRLRALGSVRRLMVLTFLADYPGATQVEIASSLNMTEVTVGYHLRDLRKVQLVEAERAGKALVYTINNDALSAIRLRIQDALIR